MSGSRGVFQPVGQKRLTNIAVCRLKKAGHRFEIAAYQNKVRDWRNGIEKDLDEVLQTTTIFTNVSKGILAKEKDLMEAFGTTDEKAICLEILKKGDLQVADKERKQEYENIFKDVAGVLVEKCVNPDSNRPYTITMLERALRDVHFSIDPKKSAKQQALEALPLLQAQFPIERARMRLRLSAPLACKEQLLEMADSHHALVESLVDQQAGGGMTSVVVQVGGKDRAQVEPGAFRELHNRLQSEMHGKGRVEVLAMTVVAEGIAADEFSNPHGGEAASTHPLAPHNASASWTEQQAEPIGDIMGGSSRTAATAKESGSEASTSAARATAGHASRTATRTATASAGTADVGTADDVLYRGSIEGLPEAHASRKERFSELDLLQPGWQVELRNKGATVDAVFFSPSRERVGAFANARRMALAAHKAQS